MTDRTNTGKLYYTTKMRGQGGRRAGDGILYDSYSEESWGGGYPGRYGTTRVRFPNDDVKPEDLNGECIIIQPAKEK